MTISTPAALTPSASMAATYTVPAGGVAAGKVLALCVVDGLGTSHTYGATDSRGNTYASASSYASPNNVAVALVVGNITTALQAGDTISVTRDGSSVNVGVIPIVCSGVSTTTDGSSGAGVGYSGSYNTGSITTTNTNDLLIIGGCYLDTSSAVVETPGAGFTDITPSGAWWSSTYGGFVAYQIVSAPGTYTGSGTFSPTANGNAAQILALEASGSAPTPNPQIAAGFFAA